MFYRSNLTFVVLYKFSLEVLPFAKIKFPNFSISPYKIMT